MNKTEQIQRELGIELPLQSFTPGIEVFGRYTLERLLGTNAVGLTWACSDNQQERQVALKLYPTVAFCDEAGLRQLRRAIDTVGKLHFPEIVQNYELIESEEWLAIVNELVDGKSLHDELEESPHSSISYDRLAEILPQITAVMSRVHADFRACHGKLNPSNILVTAEGKVKITDFAVARALSDHVQRGTRIPNAMGEIPYLSPQQLDGEVPRPGDDIYSLGCTLYECITGKPPFYDGEDLLRRIRIERPPSMAERRAEFGVADPEVPRVWEEIVGTCLDKRSLGRPETMDAMILRKDLTDRSTTIKKARKRPAKPAGQPALSDAAVSADTTPIKKSPRARKPQLPEQEIPAPGQSPIVRRGAGRGGMLRWLAVVVAVGLVGVALFIANQRSPIEESASGSTNVAGGATSGSTNRNAVDNREQSDAADQIERTRAVLENLKRELDLGESDDEGAADPQLSQRVDAMVVDIFGDTIENLPPQMQDSAVKFRDAELARLVAERSEEQNVELSSEQMPQASGQRQQALEGMRADLKQLNSAVDIQRQALVFAEMNLVRLQAREGTANPPTAEEQAAAEAAVSRETAKLNSMTERLKLQEQQFQMQAEPESSVPSPSQ